LTHLQQQQQQLSVKRHQLMRQLHMLAKFAEIGSNGRKQQQEQKQQHMVLL
jgi:hypothetical protein